MDKLKANLNNKEITFHILREGNVEIIRIPIKITVELGSFLHIGASPSPLTEKKGSVFKVDRTPVIPATSFKGALRNQLELLFIDNRNKFATIFNMDDPTLIKPCIPAPRPTKAEKALFSKGYRKNCEIRVDEDKVILNEEYICPICYFMGCSGIMGFLRFNNFYPGEGEWLIDQTNIRIDRSTQTAARGAKVEGEQVKPGTEFNGKLEIVNKTPQGFEFGQPRNIEGQVIDAWLARWEEKDVNKRKQILIEQILFPAIQNIKLLGGQKSRGAGKVRVEIIE